MKEVQILETMTEFGAALDEGKSLQTCNTDVFNGWFDIVEDWPLWELQRLIKNDGCRIKPEPVTDEIWCRWGVIEGVKKVVETSFFDADVNFDRRVWQRHKVTFEES